MSNLQSDVLIIGAGVVGMAIGIALLEASPALKVTILEKEKSLGRHASGRNSGVLHAGFYYSLDSLKAKFCKDGNSELRKLCREFNVSVQDVGKVVVAQTDADDEKLDDLFTKGIANDAAVAYSSLSIQEQTITFNQPADMTMIQNLQTLQATASSGLAVTLTSNTPAVCSIVSGQVVQVASGACSITASQPGQSLNYSAADPVTRSFIISKVDQSVSVGGVPGSLGTYSTSNTLTATKSSTGNVNWSTRAPCAIWVNPTRVRRAGGTSWCTLTLNISGDNNYNSYTRSWTVK